MESEKLSNCPKCQTPELIWDKTVNGKNWLKDQNGNWHTCQNVKPAEVSASTPAMPKSDNEWGDWDHTINGRKGYYKCKKCPEGMGILNKLDQYFQEDLKIHNAIIHPYGEDYATLRVSQIMERWNR